MKQSTFPILALFVASYGVAAPLFAGEASEPNRNQYKNQGNSSGLNPQGGKSDKVQFGPYQFVKGDFNGLPQRMKQSLREAFPKGGEDVGQRALVGGRPSPKTDAAIDVVAESADANYPDLSPQAQRALNYIRNTTAQEILRRAAEPVSEYPSGSAPPSWYDNESSAYERAMSLSSRVTDIDPDNRDALNNIAAANLGLGHYQKAVDIATKVAQKHSNNARAHTTRALAHYNLKNYPQALEDAQRALALDGNNKTAFRIAKLSSNRLTTPEDLGLSDAAKLAARRIDEEYETMIRADERAEEEEEEAQETKNSYTAPVQARQDSSLDFVKSVAGMPVNNAGSGDPAARAAHAIGRGEFHRAMAEADRAIGINPQDARAYKLRARAKEGLRDFAGMIADYKKAAALSPVYDDELADVTQKYGIRLHQNQSLKTREVPATQSPPKRTTRARRKTMRVALTVACSVLGGGLIALGLLQLLSGRRRDETSSTPQRQQLPQPAALDAGFELIRVLGNGGMGVVYEGIDKALGRKVAVKKMLEELAKDPRERKRFLQEARIVAALHHPNIVEIHSIVEHEGELYLVFEYVEGKTVEQIIAKKKRLSFQQAQWLMHGVCRALEFAHAKGVIHRDLKPANIMVTQDAVVKVMDFGIARQSKHLDQGTQTRTIAGTPQYMAPEQEEGIVRKEGDIFSLGACLYEIVTGQRPYPSPATTASKISKRYTRPSMVRAELPPELDELIDGCLEPDPDKRIHDAKEFIKRLEAIKLSSDARGSVTTPKPHKNA